MTTEALLDREVAMSRVGGDEELLKELGVLFLEESARQRVELREAFERGDAKHVERTAHGLKGSVANFGAAKAVDTAAQIELLGKRGQLEPVGDLLRLLEATLDDLAVELRQL
jgi:HPt (histidine-containing phosphotransfer) domain-containing protein